MPTKPSRARRMVRDGKAVGKWNDAGVYYIQLTADPSDTQTQPIHLGCDPGKSYSGIAVQSAHFTLYTAHLVLPFQRIKERLGAAVIKNGKVIKNVRGRALQRRVRRGRRINRKVPFHLRAHRQKRFNNRRQPKLPPSIKASRQMELRVIKELSKIFPITSIVYEVVKADVDRTSGRKGAKSGKGFSPVMTAQYWAMEQLEAIAPVIKRHGWQKDGNGTSQIRKHLGLIKCKDKKAQAPEAHAVDGIALAASQFTRYQASQSDSMDWVGSIDVTPCQFRVITRPAYFRRALHFDNPGKGGTHKRKGGTVTPWVFRSGDLVVGEKAGKVFRGWVGGYTKKAKSVSLYDHNWRRIGKFVVSKCTLLRRSNKLCVA
ncbi:RRXRR domain-containing protein [Acaryochloris marina]|nr:RRXRR domain-containing protein [Acaryochloris marina]